MKQFSVKKLLLLALVCAMALILCGCKGGSGNTFPTSEPTQKAALDAVPTVLPTDEPEVDEGPAFVPAQVSQYAGASPVPLDPVDMPTPTPRPSLTFEYGAVSADRLGISFEAPQGWYVDMSDSSMVVLTDPNAYDGFNANMTIRIQNVSSDYNLSDVKEEVRAMLKEIGQYNFIEWSTSTLDDRTLMNRDG